MDIEIKHRDEFHICGYAVETTLEGNDSDISKLYDDVFGSGRDKALQSLPGCKPGYYGLEWYTEGHKSFYYLLGREVSRSCDAPGGAVIKSIPPAQCAVARIPAGSNLIDAWTEFFYTAIPDAGYAPDAGHGFYFEYYPGGVRGDCELWTPVVSK
jgi:predicted transcriptional regulator YdeE